jgi:hypothetical protein
MHIPKTMMNVAVTLQPMAEYSTHLLSLLFSPPLLVLFFSTTLLPLLVFVYAHSFVLPFPLVFSIAFQWHYLHSCYYELQNFKNV